MIKFACSKCGKHITVKDEYAGRRGKCPGCGEAVKVPGQSATIQFSCAHCGHAIKVPAGYAGKRGKCPQCKEAVVVPAPDKEAATEAPAATITCSMCGREVPAPGATGAESMACPGCGSFIDPSSGAMASPYDDAAAVADEADAEQEPEAPAGASRGLDRRLLLIVGGAAAIVIVGLIGLVVVLKFTGSDRPRRPEPRQPARPQPTAPAAPTAETPAPPTGVRLRFAPTPGTTRTVRISTRIDTIATEAEQEGIAATESLTLDLEAATTNADGTVPIRVTLAAIRVSSEMGGRKLGEYDSDSPPNGAAGLEKMYSAFVGKDWTMTVSDQGEIVDFGLDALFQAAAEQRVQEEDAEIRARAASAEKAEQAIAHADGRFGSRAGRLGAMQKQLAEFPIFGQEKVRRLVSESILTLPDASLRPGDAWNRPVYIASVGTPMEMAAAHTLTGVDSDICTIESEGLRGPDEPPMTQDMGDLTVRYVLSGTVTATTTVERQTGWLLSKQQQTTLRGQIERHHAGQPDQDSTDQAAVDITTTVTTLE